MADTEDGMSISVNNPGCYTNVCMDLTLQSITIGAVVQSEHINDIEGDYFKFLLTNLKLQSKIFLKELAQV